jgi:GAF domain-containing protein
VLENRRPALVENTKEDPRWLPRGWEATLDLSRSAICVPLLTQDRVIGVLTLTRLQTNRFTMEDLSLLTSITLALSYSVTAKSSAARRNNGNGQ